MNITQNGFYRIEKSAGAELVIGDNLEVTIFDDLETLQKIHIGENTKVEYFSFFCVKGRYKKYFLSDSENSNVIIKSLIYSEENTIEATITSELAVDNTTNSVDILSFAGNNGNIKLDGILKIGKALKKIKGRLDEENIFLGDSGKISGIPTLLVETNDVEASHSCKMEKISDDKLFYLRSRGVDKENALRIMIEAKIKYLYSNLEQADSDFYEGTLEEILQIIK